MPVSQASFLVIAGGPRHWSRKDPVRAVDAAAPESRANTGLVAFPSFGHTERDNKTAEQHLTSCAGALPAGDELLFSHRAGIASGSRRLRRSLGLIDDPGVYPSRRRRAARPMSARARSRLLPGSGFSPPRSQPQPPPGWVGGF